jgi:hypothetical protein
VLVSVEHSKRDGIMERPLTTGAAAAAAATAASGSQSILIARNNEPEWRARIFRKSRQQGWEALHGRTTTRTTSQTTTLQKKKKMTWFRASPQAGCIVVRRLRLRVSICPDTVVMRRGNRIMIRPKQGIRILVLLFPTAEDCRAFSDCFVALNPHAVVSAATTAAAGAEEVSGNATMRPGPPSTEAAAAAVARAITPTQQQNLQAGLSEPSANEDSLFPIDGVNGDSDKNAVMAYIARLLQDEDFSEYVQSMESILMSSQDGAKMLEDFAQEDTSAEGGGDEENESESE